MTKNCKQKIMEIYPCQLKFLKLSCYGCCGDDWTNKSDVENDVWLNSKDFKEIYSDNNSSEEDLIFFKDRFARDEVSKSGVCMNLVDFGDRCLACPLHPKVNLVVSSEKTVAPISDLRIGHCDVNYECSTVKFWNLMKIEQRKEFIEFLKSKDFDNYEYSMKNVSGALINEFFESKELKLD